MTSRCRAAVVLIAMYACAACEAATPVTSPTTVPPGASPHISGPVLSGTVSISGGATIPTTSFRTVATFDAGQDPLAPPAGATCADYARGFNNVPSVTPQSFVAPVIQTNGFHNIYVGVTMTTGYHGPGTYDSASTGSLSGDAVEGIGSGSTAVYTVFHSRNPGTMTLTVNADGSGSLQLAHWDSDEVRQSAGASQVNISGVISWSCHD